MKSTLLFSILALLGLSACTKSDAGTNDNGSPIVTIDSSEFNGRLYVYTLDYVNGNNVTGANVYLYTQYDDIKRRIYLMYQKSNASAEVDFGYLLQGNYYVVSNTINKSDTSLVQVLGKRIVKRNVYLQ